MNDNEKLEVVADVDSGELKVSGATVARTIVFAVAWLNQLFAFVGAPTLDIDTSALYEIATATLTFAASAAAFWKNNSFTHSALIGDAVKNAFKKDAVE